MFLCHTSTSLHNYYLLPPPLSMSLSMDFLYDKGGGEDHTMSCNAELPSFHDRSGNVHNLLMLLGRK